MVRIPQPEKRLWEMNILSNVDIICRIYRGSIIVNREVQVGSGAATGGAHIANELPLFYPISSVYNIMSHM